MNGGVTAPLRVLLISAVRGVDPHSGDVTYTEQLLANPPSGVTYTTYDQALRSGSLVELGTRATLATSVGPRERAQAAAFAVWRKLEGLVRSSGVAYRERLRHFRVAPGQFDVVHVHVFHTRFVGEHPPIVLSAAGPLLWLYRDAWHWSRTHAKAADAFDRLVGTVWGATMLGGTKGQAAKLVAFTRYYQQWLRDRRGLPPEEVGVVRNYLGLDVAPRPATASPARLGFVAKDFEAKGGDYVLAAFEVLRRTDPALSLTIIGSKPPPGAHGRFGKEVTWIPFVPREQLLDELLPTIDIFVYPSLCDGLPYGPMEALAYGIPLVVSDYRALPELVANGAGRVASVADVPTLVAAVHELLEPEAWLEASRAARALFLSRFSARSQAAVLGEVYREACAAGDAAAGNRRRTAYTSD